MNHFIGIGRLSGDAELKYTPNGTAITSFSICISKKWKDANGNQQEKAHFFKCVMWGKLGESINKYLTKGKQVAIEAELEQNAWTDNNNVKHNTVQLNVNELTMLASPRGEGEAKTSAPPPPKNGKKPGDEDIPF